MIEAGLALLWLVVVSLALGLVARGERRARLARGGLRREMVWPRRAWGGDPDRPPASWAWARMLAEAARTVRSRSVLAAPSPGLRRTGRLGSLMAIASALTLVPFAGTWGGAADGRAMVVLDLEEGLLALVLLILLSGLAQVALGLSDRSFWSRLGAVRIAGRALVSLGLFVLVLAALVLETGSLRIADLVLAQRGTFAPVAWLGTFFEWQGAQAFEALRLPSWLLLTQPLTALLSVLALALLLKRPLARDASSGTIGAAGFGLDDDPAEQMASRLEARLASVLGAALFVAFFIGGSSIPYLESGRVVESLEPFVGQVVPALLMLLVESGVFLAKVALVLAIAARLRDSSAVTREDQWLSVATRRWLPIAWANLLLMATLWQLAQTGEGVGG